MARSTTSWTIGLALLGAAGSLSGIAPPARAQAPTLVPAVTVDGPSPNIDHLSGLSVARDGSGGVVYLKDVAGVPHVFVCRLINGVFQAPEQVDSTLGGGASSEPVIAAGNGGLLLIAFINGGGLYVVDRASPAAGYGQPIGLSNQASHPALGLTTFGKAYIAFTAVDGAGHDVRTAYYYNGRWALELAPLNASPADDAGTGTGSPQVAAAGDGVAVVVWGEAGHIYSRRVWGTAPSIVYEQADAPVSGGAQVSVDEPQVGAGGDSSYANVVFHEVLATGAQQQSRVLMNRLRGSVYDGVTQADGLSTPAGDGADQPRIAISEYGRGLVTSSRTAALSLVAATLGQNGTSGTTLRLDSLQNAGAPDAVPAFSGLFSGLIAWQQAPGPLGLPEIRTRWFSGSSFDPELVVSSPSLGGTDASRGLVAAGDYGGEQAIVWVQGTGSSTRIVAAQRYTAPGGFGPPSGFRYASNDMPLLAWSPAYARWGPVLYFVSVDGVRVAQTTSTSLRVPSPLSEGPHRWQVQAVNPAGLMTTARAATVWVDAVPPSVRLTLTGTKRAGAELHLYVSYSDTPVLERPADVSGVAQVVVRWGDGSSSQIRHGKHHAYRRAGRFTLTVSVIDRAGNTTTIVRKVTIRPR